MAKHKDVSDEELDGPEEAYEHAKVKPVSQEEESDDEGDPSTLVHESMRKSPGDKKKKGYFVPLDETSEQRNQRTIFVGNLPIEVAEKKVGVQYCLLLDSKKIQGWIKTTQTTHPLSRS